MWPHIVLKFWIIQLIPYILVIKLKPKLQNDRYFDDEIMLILFILNANINTKDGKIIQNLMLNYIAICIWIT